MLHISMLGARRTSCHAVSAFLTRSKLRACLHGGGGPQVGEVTRLAVVETNGQRLHANLQPRGPGVTLLDVVAWSLGM